MSSPVPESSAQGYEAVPTNIPNELGFESIPMDNAQSISSTYNVPLAPGVGNMPTVAPQWNVCVAVPQLVDPMAFHKFFVAGKPFECGLVLMIASTVNMALGIAMIFTFIGYSLVSGAPFWGAIFYLATGILTISAKSKATVRAVTASFALNIVSSLVSCVGSILACLDLVVNVSLRKWENTHSTAFSQRSSVGALILFVVALLNNLTILSIAIYLSVIGGRSLKRAPGTPQVFMVQPGAVASAIPTDQPRSSEVSAPYPVQVVIKNQS